MDQDSQRLLNCRLGTAQGGSRTARPDTHEWRRVTQLGKTQAFGQSLRCQLRKDQRDQQNDGAARSSLPPRLGSPPEHLSEPSAPAVVLPTPPAPGASSKNAAAVPAPPTAQRLRGRPRRQLRRAAFQSTSTHSCRAKLGDGAAAASARAAVCSMKLVGTMQELDDIFSTKVFRKRPSLLHTARPSQLPQVGRTSHLSRLSRRSSVSAK